MKTKPKFTEEQLKRALENFTGVALDFYRQDDVSEYSSVYSFLMNMMEATANADEDNRTINFASQSKRFEAVETLTAAGIRGLVAQLVGLPKSCSLVFSDEETAMMAAKILDAETVANELLAERANGGSHE